MGLSTRTRLGPYEIVDLIGAGGMGEVYRARDVRLGRDVAIKVVPSAVARDPTVLARFEREARSAAALSHPNILAIHDVGHEGATTYVVMELLDGGTLRQCLASAALPLRKAIDYAAQMADGLAAAHEKGIVHRDLKPENVFVTGDGRVKLLDFGLAKPCGVATRDGKSDLACAEDVRTVAVLTDPNQVVGTCGYMSPEQIRGQNVDHRADIFAFGATLYEMVTGRRAFDGPTRADTMTAVLERDVTPPALPDGSPVPVALERIILRCLEKAPPARFQSTTDLAFALRAVTTASQVTATSNVPPARRPVSRRWAGTAGAFVSGVALCAIAFTALGALRTSAPPSRAVVRFAIDVPPPRQLGTIALSPDGSRLAYEAVDEVGRHLFIRGFDQPDDTPLAGTEDGAFPFFSPDGKWIAFFAGNRLKKVPAGGGTVETICETTAPEMPKASDSRAELGASGTWTTDDTILFSEGASGLWRVGSAGGARVRVTGLDTGHGDLGHAWPDVLPDGRGILFCVWRGMRFDATPMAMVQDAGTPYRVVMANGTAPRSVDARHVLYVTSGKLLLSRFDATSLAGSDAPVPIADSVGYAHRHPQFAVSRSGDLAYALAAREPAGAIVRVGRDGREQTIAEMPRGAAGAISLSPDGRRLAVQTNNGRNMAVWTVDVTRGVASRVLNEGNAHAAIWGCDNQHLLFSSDAGGAANVYMQPVDGTGTAQVVLSGSRHQDPGSCSRDGRWIAYLEVDPVTGWDLWKFDTLTRQATVFRRSRGNEQQPAISPDGRWIVYTSTESGAAQVYVEAFPSGGQRVQLSADGGREPVWSPDGQAVFYRNDSLLMGVALRLGTAVSAAKPVEVLRDSFVRATTFGPSAYAVSPDGQSFYFLRLHPEPPAATRINVVLGWLNEFRDR